MRNSINKINERITNQNQTKNQKINQIHLPIINAKNNEINKIQNNNIRNPQSANLSNKLLNNAIEIGKKIYNRDIITPNLVNIYTSFLEKENKSTIVNNNNSKSSPKNRNINYLKNKNKDKNKIIIQNQYIASFLNDNKKLLSTERNKNNNDFQLINNKINNSDKEQLLYLNNINYINVNKYINSNQKKILNKNKNNYKNKEILYYTRINNNNNTKSSNQLKNIEIPYLLKAKNKNIILPNNINIFQTIDRKQSKENRYDDNKLADNNKNIKIFMNKRKNNSQIKLSEKIYYYIDKDNMDNINDSYSKNNVIVNNNNNNIYNSKNNKEDLCFISYSYNEYSNIPHRKTMEDYHCIKQNLLKQNTNIYSYFGIFDGHSGNEVALFLSKNLHKIISSQLININLNINNKNNSNLNNDIEYINNRIIELIKNSFKIADEKIINNLSYNKDVGSTGTIILLYKIKNNENVFSRYIVCANIGDSKGYILTKNNFIQITKEHKCNDLNEVERIKKNGGIVFNKRVFGTLMLTRSFGDKEMKKYGVISIPDCFSHKIKDEDLYIVIASDGIWDAVCEEEIMQMGGEKLSSDDFSKKIVKLAIDKGTIDNISCIVIKLNKDS